MEFLMKFVLIWWAFGVVVGMSGWLAATILKPRYPAWWRRVVADDDPYERAANRPPKVVGLYRPGAIIISPLKSQPYKRIVRKPYLSSAAFQSGRKQSDAW